VPTWSGTVFTAFVSDVFSRRIVGWRTAASMPTGLPLDALEMALWTRGQAGQEVRGLVHHSDAGSQYTSIRYATRLLDAGALASIGSVGDSYDNALAESVIGLDKTECVRHDRPWRGVDDLELATLGWVHWLQPDPAAQQHRARPPDRVRGRVLPSHRSPAAAAAGRTQPPLNPGRFKSPRNSLACSWDSPGRWLSSRHGEVAVHFTSGVP
jgi:putative transposase